FGIAAYTAARVLNGGADHLTVAVAAIAATLAASAIFATLALRGTGLGFVMITVALGQIVWGIAYRWISITNGDNGVAIKGRPGPFGLSPAPRAAFYGAPSSSSSSRWPRWRSSSPRPSAPASAAHAISPDG